MSLAIGISGGSYGGGSSAGGSISVALSDNAPNVGDTITITATATGFTPDSYLYFVYDGSGNIVFIAEQASNTFNWLVPSDGLSVTEIYVLGVENGIPDVTAFGTADITISSSFLLDTPEGAGANFAFSFFRLRAGHTNPIALIRRSSDNEQKAFYFDSNNVLSLSSEDGSGTSLSSWIGSDNGYLVTGYSQDILGVTFTASSASDQQQIIANGSLITVNGVVAIDGNKDRYVISTSLTVESAFIVAKNDGYNLANAVFAGNAQGINWGGSFAGVDGIGAVDSLGNKLDSNVEDLNPHLASLLTNTGIYVDGTLQVSGTINPMTITRVVGREDDSTIGMNGKTACIVSYSTDKTADRATIEGIINDNFTTSLLP